MDLRLLAASSVWGLATAVPYSVLMMRRHGEFDANKTAGVFLGGAVIPSYGRMLYAALRENVHELPPDWPTFAALAAVVALGLALKQLYKAYKSASSPQVRAEPQPAKAPDLGEADDN
jgi:drug/metabolite transporter (DMT)-like permease